MPPETKPTISSLAEMTCENCVYSWPSMPGTTPETANDFIYECGNPDSFYTKIESPQTDFCSKGKWLTSELHYAEAIHGPNPHLADFDTCYYLFGRAK